MARSALGLAVADIAGELDCRQAVALALLDVHVDIDALAFAGTEREQREPALIANMGLRFAHRRPQVAAVLIGQANALGILLEFAGVVGPRKQILENDGMRNPNWPQIPHRLAQRAGTDVVISAEGDLAHLHGRPFLHVEDQLDRGRRNVLDLGAYGRKLVAVLGQHFPDHGDGVRDPCRVVLALDREPDLLLLEAVEHVGLGDGIQTLISDVANGGLLADVDVEDNALRRVLLLDADVLEIAGIPEGVEVALDGKGIEGLADAAEHAGQDGFPGNPAGADHPNLDNFLLAGRSRSPGFSLLSK